MSNTSPYFDQLKAILVDTFEIEADDITPEASLYEDLDIDSIDAVDLVVQLRELTGKKIKPEDFKSVRTIQDVLDAVDALMAEDGDVQDLAQ
ncbi:Acyl carrier protein [BD1-7 clade bacterium]|uniref:Acyl carrier protein n=1 Tax=BD1-7 clade bacterium TaxID=2029982 RepID=A0A5S9QL70_9GAMM|nr:Acyl carrier protein [BD1-7 clade bacterium]CAA0119144.1 Acyl carrier protein [BD1-7 clade bacterium]